MTFDYENLLLLKSPQNNVVSNIAITEEKKQCKSNIWYMPEALWESYWFYWWASNSMWCSNCKK